jgi:hypothetical protein
VSAQSSYSPLLDFMPSSFTAIDNSRTEIRTDEVNRSFPSQ